MIPRDWKSAKSSPHLISQRESHAQNGRCQRLPVPPRNSRGRDAHPENFDHGYSDIPGGWNCELGKSVVNWQHLLPMFRWKALKVPLLGLHHLVWVDDLDFDRITTCAGIACLPRGPQGVGELVSGT